MSHFGSIEPAADPKGRRRPWQGDGSAPGASWPLTEATIARSAAPNNHAAARLEANSWIPWPRTVDAGKARAGSGSGSGSRGQMSQPIEDGNNKRHTRIWDCFHVDVDATAAAPRRNNLHLSAPVSSRNRTPPSQQGGEEDDSGVWDEVDDFLAQLELAQLLGDEATLTKKAILAGGMGNPSAKMVPGREGVGSACEEMVFF